MTDDAEFWADDATQRSLADLINRVLDRGVVVNGQVTLSIAEVDLVFVGLNALLTSTSTARRVLGARSVPPGSAKAAARARSAAQALGSGAGGVSPAATSAGASGAGPPRPGPLLAENAIAEGIAAEVVRVTGDVPGRIDLDPDGVQRDLGRLVLMVVELLRRLVEHQAVQRMDDGDLTEEQVERMGLALARLEDKVREIQKVFGLADADLNLDLGPLGKLL